MRKGIEDMNGRKHGHQQFLLFSQSFQKPSIPER